MQDNRAAAPGRIPWPRLRISNILCPVDFSECSSRALRYGLSIARRFHSRLFLQHVVHVPLSAFLEGAEPAAPRETFQKNAERARQQMWRLMEQHKGPPAEIFVLINEGDVREQVLQNRREQHADLVVMGTHGRRGLDRLRLGSVTERIVQQIACPVLVLSGQERETEPEPDEPVSWKTLLVATDFSTNSDRALVYAIRLAEECAGKVILFHAAEAAPAEMPDTVGLFPERSHSPREQLAEAWEKLRLQVPDAAIGKCETVYEVREGNPREQILRVAREKEADLIVMGAQGLGRSSRPHGTLSMAVARDGSCPVLVVPNLPV
jgi:nucleotide-binding universal stress UspA family protein